MLSQRAGLRGVWVGWGRVNHSMGVPIGGAYRSGE